MVYRDLFDTKLMGALTPRPAQVIGKFQALYAERPPEGHRLVLSVQPGHQLYPPGPHRQGHAVEDPHRVRGAGHHHQPVQAGEGPQGHRRRPEPARLRLSPVPAVRRERGLRRPGEPPRPAEPPHRAHHHQRLPLVFAVLPLCVLQRALHLPEQRAHAHEDRPGLLCQAAGLCGPVPPLLRGLQRRPAHRGRLHPGPRPLPGRAVHLRHGEGPGGDPHLLPGL